MNKKDNKRKRDSQKKIEKAFVELIQNKEVNEITVTDICKITKLNRSTFYANYIDIYDLVDKIRNKMIEDFFQIYKEETRNKSHSYDFLKLFHHIKENQLFYKTYFKLNIDSTDSFIYDLEKEAIRFHGTPSNIEYHIEFFKAGLNAIIKKWLNNNCDKSPTDMVKILETEYNRKRID